MHRKGLGGYKENLLHENAKVLAFGLEKVYNLRVKVFRYAIKNIETRNIQTQKLGKVISPKNEKTLVPQGLAPVKAHGLSSFARQMTRGVTQRKDPRKDPCTKPPLQGEVDFRRRRKAGGVGDDPPQKSLPLEGKVPPQGADEVG